MANQIEIIDVTTPKLGNLYNSPKGQLLQKFGRFETVYVGDRCGTIKNYEGKYFDWWMTDEVIEGNFKRIEIHPAK